MVTSGELVERALGLAEVCERTDLYRRLTVVRGRHASPTVRVLVVGEPKQGKSSLVNALLGVPVCPVADDVATVVPTVVRGGETPRAVLVRGTEDAPERTPVAIERAAAQVTGAAAAGVLQAEVELPRRLLDGGLELVDTAGVGGVGGAMGGGVGGGVGGGMGGGVGGGMGGGIGGALGLAVLDLLPAADAVLFVSDASQEFTAPEMAFLEQAAALCPHVVCVLTKTDACPEWRTIAGLDRRHLTDRGVEAPLLPVSSALATLAVAARDRSLHEESGIDGLVRYLRADVVGRADALARRALAHDLGTVTEQLTLAVRSELRSLEDPAGREELLRELEDARAAADELRRRSARWQQVLGDGVTDLMADIDHDLRDRTRVVVREAEEVIAARDPGPAWPEITEWLERRIAEAVADSYVWAEQRSHWLAGCVVDQFARDGGGRVPALEIGAAADALGALVDLPPVDAGRLTVRERAIIGLRGSYSGVLMTGLVTSLAGLAIINPFSVAAGVLLGRKAYNDDRKQRRSRREAEAQAVVRRHLDEVVFQVGKHLKDRLRTVQRTLRDLISDTADELAHSLAEAVRAAQRTTKEATTERDARVRTLRQRLAQLDRLGADIASWAPAPAEPAARLSIPVP